MIVAITTPDNTLEAPVSHYFERASYIILANTSTGELRAFDLRDEADATPGAGEGAVTLLEGVNVERLYTGQLAPQSLEALTTAGIRVHQKTEGSVEQILQSLVDEGVVKGKRNTQHVEMSPSIPAPDASVERLAIPSEKGTVLDAFRSNHFGRCQVWTLVDVAAEGVKQVFNLDNPGHDSGSCITAVRQLKAHSVDILIVDGIGRNPFEGFRRTGIQVLKGSGRTVGEAVDAYLEGRRTPVGENDLCGSHA